MLLHSVVVVVEVVGVVVVGPAVQCLCNHCSMLCTTLPRRSSGLDRAGLPMLDE